MGNTVEAPDWSTIPAPLDDGATRHLKGARMASVPLQATNGEIVDLSVTPGRVVVYAYPRTGKPGIENPEGWDMIPGARGCTPQTCSFRDHFAELRALGVDHLFGLSAQDPDLVREGDVFVATSLSRLARSVLHLWQIVEKLQAKGVALRILGMGIDTSTSHGRLVLTLIGGIVQWEREVMLERQQEGIAKARQVKKYTGRKRSIDAAQVKALRAEGLSYRQVAKRLGIALSSVQRLA
jgi:Resolvase, N terminal domain/Helix-turn-helix domain of resolvase